MARSLLTDPDDVFFGGNLRTDEPSGFFDRADQAARGILDFIDRPFQGTPGIPDTRSALGSFDPFADPDEVRARGPTPLQDPILPSTVVKGAAFMTEPFGTAIDAFDVFAGLAQDDPGRVGVGLAGAVIPFGMNRANRLRRAGQKGVRGIDPTPGRPEVPIAATVRFEDGTEFDDQLHAMAFNRARERGVTAEIEDASLFRTNKGRVVGRSEAQLLARQAGQVPGNRNATQAENLQLFRPEPLSPDGELAAQVRPDFSPEQQPRGFFEDDFFSPENAQPAGRGFADEPGGLLSEGAEPVGPQITDLDRKVAENTNKFEGSTIAPDGTDLAGEDLYSAAVDKSSERVVRTGGRDLLPSEVAEYRMQQSHQLGLQRSAIGTWVNGDGDVVFDVPHTFRTRDAALRAAGEADQDAIFDLGSLPGGPREGTSGEILVSARQRAEGRARAVQRSEAAAEEHRRNFMMGLTPDEQRYFLGADEATRTRALEQAALVPSPREFASVILRGAEQRGWYRSSGAALAETFGNDAPRFAALLAAQSPNKSVRSNLELALETWERWTDAGRPTSEAAIRKLFPSGVIDPSDTINSVRALTTEMDELTNLQRVQAASVLEEGVLSGPKVDPFYANLVGETQRIVNDTHMARGAGTTPKKIASKSRSLAVNSTTRRAADEVTRMTGVPIDPREAQEMAWSTIRGLTNATGAGSAEEAMRMILDDPDLLIRAEKRFDDYVQDSDAFGILLNDPQFRDQVTRLSITGEAPTPRTLEGMGGVQTPEGAIRSRDLTDVGERIDAGSPGGTPFFAGVPLSGAAVARILQGERHTERTGEPGDLVRSLPDTDSQRTQDPAGLFSGDPFRVPEPEPEPPLSLSGSGLGFGF